MWGMGVTSLIIVTSRPAVCRARIAASLPEPGPLTNTSTVFRPCSMAAFAAVSAAVALMEVIREKNQKEGSKDEDL